MNLIVGGMLKKARLEKQITLEEASRELKIRKKYLEALESESFDLFSSSVHVTGFLKNYSRFLNLDESQVMAFYRRDFGGEKDSLKNVKPVGVVLPWMSHNKIAFLTALIIFFSFFFYLFFQYSQFLKPPRLIVDNPGGDARVKSLEIVVSGRTTPETTLQINGQEITVGSDGIFKETLVLKNGANVLNFTAINRVGRTTSVVRNVVSE